MMFGLTGCNLRLSPYAAIVNGSEISQQELNDSLSAIVNNSSYKCTIQASGTTHLLGAGDGTYSSAFSAEVLSILIQDNVVHQHVARLGLTVPSSLQPIAMAQLEASTTPATSCPGSGASLITAFRPSYLQLLLRFQMDEDVLAAHLVGTTLQKDHLASYVASHENTMSMACVSVIVVASKAVAASLQAQVRRGASFATLAKAHSTDTSTAPQGGVIGCVPTTAFNPPLDKVIAGLTTGRVSSPISFSSSWLLLLVTKRQAEAYSQEVSSIVSAEQSTFSTLFPQLIRSAKIEVDPQYGTWNKKPNPPAVEPNAGPPGKLVPNASANTGPSS